MCARKYKVSITDLLLNLNATDRVFQSSVTISTAFFNWSLQTNYLIPVFYTYILLLSYICVFVKKNIFPKLWMKAPLITEKKATEQFSH